MRLLRAKVGELEAMFLAAKDQDPSVIRLELNDLRADIALVADILASYIEDAEASRVLYEAHTENLIERMAAVEGPMVEIGDPLFNEDGTPWRPDPAWLEEAREGGEITEEQYQAWRDK